MKYWYRAETYDAAQRHRLDGERVIAVVLTESYGNHYAYRYEPQFWFRYLVDKPDYKDDVPARVSASYGLMQVMFPTARDFGFPRDWPPERLFEPAISLEYGCRVLAERLAWAKGDWEAAFASYNGGKTRDNAPGVNPKRNQAYVGHVLRWFEKVKNGEVTG